MVTNQAHLVAPNKKIKHLGRFVAFKLSGVVEAHRLSRSFEIDIKRFAVSALDRSELRWIAASRFHDSRSGEVNLLYEVSANCKYVEMLNRREPTLAQTTPEEWGTLKFIGSGPKNSQGYRLRLVVLLLEAVVFF